MPLSPDTVLTCDECGAEFLGTTAGLARGRHRKRTHPTDEPAVAEPTPIKQSSERAPTTVAEVVPARPKKSGGLLGRFRKAKAQTTATPSRERAPKKPGGFGRGPRVPLDTDIGDVWAFFGRRLENGPFYPTGRMMKYQAPGAGVIFDKALAGTLPDRMFLQPMARNRDKYEDAFYIAAGPVLTFGITRTFQMREVALQSADLEQVEALDRRLQVQFEGLDWLLTAMLPRLAEGKKIAEEKAAAEAKIIADAFPELAETGRTPAEVLRDLIFSAPDFAATQGAPDGPADHPSSNHHQPHPVAERTGAP